MEVGKRVIIYLSLHCHHQSDSCIKIGSDRSHLMFRTKSQTETETERETDRQRHRDRDRETEIETVTELCYEMYAQRAHLRKGTLRPHYYYYYY